MEPNNIEVLQQLCSYARAWFGDSAIIAGGAPRDTLSGVPVKDVDIFVKVNTDDLEGGDIVNVDVFTETIEKLNGASAFTRNCQAFASAYDGVATFQKSPESYGGLADLCDIEIPGKQPIQIVALFEDPVDDVHAYDFTISQVFVTPRGLFQTPAAFKDRQRRFIRYTGDNGRDAAAIERSRKRLSRLRLKYPDWIYVDCYGLDVPAGTIAKPLDQYETLLDRLAV
jgi:hypothetical protein